MKDLSRVVHHPGVSHEGFASLAVPTYRASTITYKDAESFDNRRKRGLDGYMYGMYGTPTTRTLQAQLSALEGAEYTMITPSGQAAIALVFLTVLLPGDKVLLPDCVYPPTRLLCTRYLAARGIEHEIYDPLIGAGIGDLIDARTKLIWIESPGSTTMEISDTAAITRVARERGVLTGCDNTWATPLLFKPLAHGVDFATEALTKYIAGHSDVVLGSISVRDTQLYQRLWDSLQVLGTGVSPDDCALALRGLETLGVRLAHCGSLSIELAGRIQQFPAVTRVMHPALPSCPGHEFWLRDFAGASGVFSVLLDPRTQPALNAALDELRVFTLGASWGGTHSLIGQRPVQDDRSLRPWTDDGPILRISIGLEDPDDLWEDLQRLFLALGSALAEASP
jgi:cysteine-S-conjugate beta-lyase